MCEHLQPVAIRYSHTGAKVRKGQIFVVSPFAIHHDQKLWGESVNDFWPERWLASDKSQLGQSEQNFFAFGYGPRRCPGERFGLLEVKLTLIRIFQSFTISLTSDQVRFWDVKSIQCHYCLWISLALTVCHWHVSSFRACLTTDI